MNLPSYPLDIEPDRRDDPGGVQQVASPPACGRALEFLTGDFNACQPDPEALQIEAANPVVVLND